GTEVAEGAWIWGTGLGRCSFSHASQSIRREKPKTKNRIRRCVSIISALAAARAPRFSLRELDRIRLRTKARSGTGAGPPAIRLAVRRGPATLAPRTRSSWDGTGRPAAAWD